MIKELNFEVGTCDLTEIDPGDRARKDYGDLDGLEDTIESFGLMAPLVVEALPPGTHYKYKLRAGGRRYFVFLRNGLRSIPIRIYRDIDEHTGRMLEMIENKFRKDLTWEESVELDELIHKTQTDKHGQKISTAKDAPGWTQQDTAKLLQVSTGSIAESLKLARAIKSTPEIKQCKNANEAKAFLKKLERIEANRAKVESIKGEDATKEGREILLALADSYEIKDAIEAISTLQPDTFDLIEIDPPYAIDYDTMVVERGNAETFGYVEVEKDNYLTFMDNVIKVCVPVMKEGSWLILWHGVQWSQQLKAVLEANGLSPYVVPGIWNKSDGNCITQQPGRSLANAYETFFYASKGKPDIKKRGRLNVFTYKGVPVAHRVHPTERPLALMEDLLETFTGAGSKILVPFAGSGITLMAAHNLHMEAQGYDLNPAYKDAFFVRVMTGVPRKLTQGPLKLERL
jgi:site-specific DNA-methyltransferase (adenine-specific)